MHTQSREREMQQQQRVKNKMALVVPEEEEEEANYTTEFRNHDDDAWYTVWVKLVGNQTQPQTLRVRYDKFSEAEDNLFELSNFESFENLRDFSQRFRPLSRQIQDDECRLLVHGVKVCACQHRLPDDARFYDAIIEGVRHSPFPFFFAYSQSHAPKGFFIVPLLLLLFQFLLIAVS